MIPLDELEYKENYFKIVRPLIFLCIYNKRRDELSVYPDVTLCAYHCADDLSITMSLSLPG